MSGNSIGKIFKVTTCGESHGVALCGIIDGMPPGIKLDIKYLQEKLNNRSPGNNIFTSQRRETDKLKIISGIFNGITTGCSIGILIKNKDFRSLDYENIKNIYRPGHADYTYDKKYGIRDYRGGGRSSARETAIRVAAGSIARQYLLKKYKIKIYGYITQIGHIKCKIKNFNKILNNNNYLNKIEILNIINLIKKLKIEGDSVGAKIKVIAKNVMPGLGAPVFDKLDADLAHAFMSINAVKGVEIGDGFKVINKLGSENRDEIDNKGFITNHSGGILGGISNGENIIVNLAFKPTSSILIPGKTIDINNKKTIISTSGRHDVCVGIRAIPIVKSMMSIIIMDHILRQKAQCGINKNKKF